MRQIKVEALTNEAFAPFGQFYSMEQPQGYALCGELHKFFPDRVNADSNHRVGYSPILVKKPAKMVITQQEYHTTTWEMILPLNDDMILHVAPASGGTPVTHLTKAFRVPKNTLIKMNAILSKSFNKCLCRTLYLSFSISVLYSKIKNSSGLVRQSLTNS